MSSYFDTMGRCAQDPKAVAKLVFDQYRAYLRELQDEVVSEDADRLSDLMTHVYAAHEKYKDDPHMEIQAIHSVAHDVGRSGLRLKDGRYAGDNPRIVY